MITEVKLFDADTIRKFFGFPGSEAFTEWALRENQYWTAEVLQAKQIVPDETLEHHSMTELMPYVEREIKHKLAEGVLEFSIRSDYENRSQIAAGMEYTTRLPVITHCPPGRFIKAQNKKEE